MNKKVNIKKFLSKFTQNSLLVQLFKMHEVKNIPNILDGKNDEKVSDDWDELYKSLELEKREEINKTISNINILCSKDSYDIYKEYLSKVTPTANEIMAFSFNDKALAFYIDHFEKFEDITFIISFYKKNSWKRFEAKGEVKKEIESDKKNNIVGVNDELREKFSEYLEAVIGSNVSSSLEVKTLKHDNMYFTNIKYKDGGDKNISLVYIRELGEVILKASGSKEAQFSYAEMYMKKITEYAMDYKELSYDLDTFVNLQDFKSPLQDNTNVNAWAVKGVKITSGRSQINFTFKLSDEEKYMQGLHNTFNNLNMIEGLKSGIHKINSVSINMQVMGEDYNKGKKNVGVIIKENSTNLNILKKEHRLIDKILKDRTVCNGWKDIEISKQK
jgi:hypothetical protein